MKTIPSRYAILSVIGIPKGLPKRLAKALFLLLFVLLIAAFITIAFIVINVNSN